MKISTLILVLLFSLIFVNNEFAQDINKYWSEANQNYNNKNYKTTIKYCDSVLEYKNKLGDKTKAQVYVLQAQSYFEVNKKKEAKAAILEAKKMSISDNKLKLYIAHTDGDINLGDKDYSSAIESFKTALTLTNNEKEKLKLFKDISYAYSKIKKYKDAIDYCEKSIQSAKTLNETKEEVKGELELSKQYSNYGNYDKALTALKAAKENSSKIGNYKLNEIEQTEKLLEENKNNSESATTDFDVDEDVATLKLIENITISKAKSVAEIEKLSEKMQLVEYRIKAQADEYEKQILTQKLKTIEKEKELEISEVTIAKTKAELTAKEAKLSEEKALSEKRKTLIYGSLIVLVLAALAILTLILLFRNKQKSNKALRVKNTLIEKQKSDIKNKADQIHDSIQYARKIQQAILPSVNSFKKTFLNSFIYLNPKEKVSGDFFWVYKTEKYRFAAAIDCTGHGVPGAFMTIICRQILNDIVIQNPNIKPSEILTKASKQLEVAFKQYNEELGLEVKDGMDLSLIRIDNFNNLLHSGARNPLYIIREKELIELKGTRKSVSASNTAIIDVSFEDNELKLLANDYIYFFSDGFVDQKGEKTEKKYYYKNFRETLKKLAEQPIEEQLKSLNHEFINWKGNQEQLDDVLIIGIDPMS